jgi:tRNA nucleotidyltransferase (CCA-adding enzyme)
MNTVQVLQRLDKETKAEVYLVGGFVRDLLRNKNNMDLDIVVRGLSMRNIKKFLVRYGKVKEVNLAKTNDSFSVNILLFRASSDTFEAQISLPRRGKKQIPDSHNTLRQDVRFRDFKINAMYLPISYKSKRDVLDMVGGKEDIMNRRLTANGSAVERIRESPIRMMRAISLASRTNYAIDDEVMEAISLLASLITKCPAEAIRYEFDKILMSKKPSKYLRLLNKTGLLEYIAPELYRCVGVKQDKRYHKYDVFTHLIYTCDNTEPDPVLRLAGLLHDIGKTDTRKEVVVPDNGIRVTFHKHEMVSVKMTRTFLRRLKYDSETARAVLSLVKLHMYHFTREWTDAAVRKFIKKSDIGEEYMDYEKIGYFPLFKLRAAERMGNGLKGIAVTDRQRDFEKKIVDIFKESKVLEVADLEINGNKLMETFNIKPGVHVGEILNSLLDQVLEKPSLNNELDLLKLSTEYLYNEIN